METTLGIDVGTNSIGLALIDNSNSKILYSGVRIFPEGVIKETIGQGDKEESRNAERRNKRQSRRLYYRKRLRKIKLLEILLTYQMCPLTQEELKKWKNWDKQAKSAGQEFPASTAFKEWLKMNPYELRTRALEENLTLYELGRIFYHFIQRRGFLSSRKGKEEGKIYSGKDNMTGIDETSLQLNDKTLGQYLYDISYKKGEKHTSHKPRVRARYTLRDMYIHEFEEIWKRQASHLKLNTIQAVTYKNIFINGSPSNKENNRLIEKLKHTYGVTNITLQNNYITVQKTVPLKELLGGKIEYNPENQLKYKSNESILFWQRPLRSQKNLLSKCSLEGRLFYDKKQNKWITIGPSPVPLSHPEYEIYRAYQFINNIRYGKNEKLTTLQREEVFELMCSESSDFKFSKIPKRLKLTEEKFNYDDETKVPTCKTIKQLRSLFDAGCLERNLHDIWHCFYFYEDNDMLFNKLRNTYSLKTENPEIINKIKLTEGYANLSLKAIRNINPYLEKGYTYSTAVLLGGIRNAFGKRFAYFTEFENEIEQQVIKILKEDNSEGETIEKIKNFLINNNFGFKEKDKAFNKLYHHSQPTNSQIRQEKLPEIENLRNPIVQQSLNEMRRMVNKLLEECKDTYGKEFKFNHIHVELGRDLRNSKKRREEQTRTIRENEKENEEAIARLAEYGLKPSRENIQKYLLYKEIADRTGNKVACPYTGKTISITHLLGGDSQIQIEHIIPYSISLDDSFSNKTLCFSQFNNEKGKKTPYEFYQIDNSFIKWGEKTWEDIENRAYRLLPYQKAKRFISQKLPDKDNFIQRQLNDSRYIGKKAVEILSTICDDVKSFPGQLTSTLRHLWGINNIVEPVNTENFNWKDIEIDSVSECYAIIDKNRHLKSICKKNNNLPERTPNEIMLSGTVNKNKFDSKIIKNLQAENTKNGKYWKKTGLSSPIGWTPVFTEKPLSENNTIVFKGNITKGIFTCESIRQKLHTDLPDGTYWISLPVLEHRFLEGNMVNTKKINSSQIQNFGTVKEGIFKSYTYSCRTKTIDGKYWCIIDTDFNSPLFTRVTNELPYKEENQLILKGTVDEKGDFYAEEDIQFKVSTSLKSGMYYGLFNIEYIDDYFYPIESAKPTVTTEEQLLEGNIWIDKQTGEFKFDPKKNRDDHRHHAVDAIVVALSNQSMFQRLSTYHAQQENEEKRIDSTKRFPYPWQGFFKDAKESIDQILISFKQTNKTLSKISKTVIKEKKKFLSVGYAVRGQLHKETVYGQRQSPGNTKKSYHIRKDIRELKTSKHIKKIVDNRIRSIIEEYLRNNFNINTSEEYTIPAYAFFKDGNYTIHLPNKNGAEVPVKKIRLKEELGKAECLKNNLNQYVNPRNNHHVIIYKDSEDNLKEKTVSFWTVIERLHQKQSPIQIPEDGKELVTTLQINDMFILGLSDEEFELYKQDRKKLSAHLYRIQKISDLDYNFRYHLASTLLNEKEAVRIGSFNAWQKANPIKVKIDVLGNLIKL